MNIITGNNNNFIYSGDNSNVILILSTNNSQVTATPAVDSNPTLSFKNNTDYTINIALEQNNVLYKSFYYIKPGDNTGNFEVPPNTYTVYCWSTSSKNFTAFYKIEYGTPLSGESILENNNLIKSFKFSVESNNAYNFDITGSTS